jgi:splicing factor U2AF 65 kDa subunit
VSAVAHGARGAGSDRHCCAGMTRPAWMASGSVPGSSSASGPSGDFDVSGQAPGSSSRGFSTSSGLSLDATGIAAPSLSGPARDSIVQAALAYAGFGSSSGVDPSTRSGRRLFIGNLPPAATREDLMAFFTDVIAKVYRSDPGLIVSTDCRNDRGFGFVEFSSMELAAAALSLDGVLYHGSALRLSRPTEYSPAGLPPMGPVPSLNLAAVGLGGGAPVESADKLFVGGVPPGLTEENLRELLESFGSLKYVHLAKDPGNAQPKGFAFCEYTDSAVTERAIMGLNSLEIMPGRALTVRRAGAAPPSAVPPPAAPVPRPASFSTSVLRLTNMLTPMLMNDSREVEDIRGEVMEACGAHGQVQSVVIPTEGPATAVVFVKFQSASQAESASRALGGRTFDGRVVGASFADEGQFAIGNYI